MYKSCLADKYIYGFDSGSFAFRRIVLNNFPQSLNPSSELMRKNNPNFQSPCVYTYVNLLLQRIKLFTYFLVKISLLVAF